MDRSVLIAVPAFNEENTILAVLKSVKNYGYPIVFNNNSTDNTKQISVSNNVEVNDVHLQGYENVIFAICKFFKNSNYKKLIIIDGDGEVGLSSIDQMIGALDSKDIVTGKRDKIYRPSEKFICSIFKIFYGIDDVFCGFKGFKHPGISDDFKKDTFSTSVFNKNADKTSIPVKVFQREGDSKLGSGIRLELSLLLGGLRGFFS